MNSQPTWFLKNVFPRKIGRKQTIYVSVLNASIPCTFLNCDYFNNVFHYIDGSSVVHTITIPQGNYNVATFATYMNTITATSGLTFVYNSVQNSYKITFSGTYTFYGDSTCFELIGLSAGNHTATGSITSNVAVNFFTITNILVMCDNLVTNNVHDTQQNNRTCLLSIPVTSGANTILVYQNFNNLRSELSSFDSLNNFKLSLFDQDGDPLDLNGAHWTISFLFQIV